MKLLTLWRLELLKLFMQKGAYAGFAVLASLSGLFVWGTWQHGPEMASHEQVSDMFVMGGKLISAQSVCYMMLAVPLAVQVLIPLLVATIAGGLIAGETKTGTMRTILVRPVHRLTLTVAKTLTAWCHAILLVAFLLGFTWLVAQIAFGAGDLVSLGGAKLTVIARSQAWWHLLLAYGFAAVGMCAVASIALLLSSLFENSLTAAGLTVAFLIVSGVLMAIPYFEFLKEYLLTAHLSAYEQAFRTPVGWDMLQYHLAYIAPYIYVPAALTAVVTWRRDVTC